MNWIKLTLRTSPELESHVSDFLLTEGAAAITLEDAEDQPILEPVIGTTPLWQNIMLSGFFSKDAAIEQICDNLKGQFAEDKIQIHQIESIVEQDWQKVCTDAFQPRLFGERLWVYPSWSEVPDVNLPHVLLDPGMAFGTGNHPTTALCLSWLANNPPIHQRVIDYGCGSGILAIAALKLGANQAWAVDIDPQALEATIENALRNELYSPLIEVRDPKHLPNEPVDLLIANILAKPLVELASDLIALVKIEGRIVLSGILTDQMEQVMLAYAPHIQWQTHLIQDDWVLLEGIKK